MIRLLKELRNKYRHRPVAVLGAGPNLPDDLKKIPKESVLLSVNWHAGFLVDFDYMVFADHPQKSPDLWNYSNASVGKRLTHITGYSDWDFAGVDYWEGGMSATFATWIACYMGGNPVLICGMDCFQSDKKYFYKRKPYHHPCMTAPLDHHLQAWRKVFFNCKHPENIRAVSGPLMAVFGKYESNVKKEG